MGWPLCLGKAQRQQGGEQKGVAVLPEAGEQIVQGLQHPGEPPGRKSAFAARCRPDEFRRQQLPQLGADLQKVVPFAADRFHSCQQLVFAALAEQGEQLASQLGMLLQAAIRQKGQGGADGVGSFRRPAKLLLGVLGQRWRSTGRISSGVSASSRRVCTRERMVGRSMERFSAVRINTVCSGGSSRILSRAFWA